jgi:predicted nuclease of predicted toxin-antitoxin system
MRIKLDENIPVVVAEVLANMGHSVDTVAQEKLTGKPDSDIWAATQEGQRFFITQDLDFSDLRRFRLGTHLGLMIIRLAIPARGRVLSRIREVFEFGFTESWANCLVVVTDRKIRVIQPQQ